MITRPQLAASVSLPVIDPTERDFPTYNEPHCNRFGYPIGMIAKVINPANINKHRVAQLQKNANDTSHKRSGAPKESDKTDAKFRNSVKAVNRFLVLESVSSANSNMPPKRAIETVTSQGTFSSSSSSMLITLYLVFTVGLFKARTIDSKLESQTLKRSSSKTVPQPETPHSYAMDSNAFCQPKISRIDVQPNQIEELAQTESLLSCS
ncbi:hypothetical protein QAD02_014185 [Eretmocerus hayati]|uniref:Uncharacterized protein n=1 Tax=Eretmocerus hayati TaxID=131215 RepID=A0ACC2P4L7_9HYME|nr:hypothetical protein QAD02_014185 [Eretmocerus hayati]